MRRMQIHSANIGLRRIWLFGNQRDFLAVRRCRLGSSRSGRLWPRPINRRRAARREQKGTMMQELRQAHYQRGNFQTRWQRRNEGCPITRVGKGSVWMRSSVRCALAAGALLAVSSASGQKPAPTPGPMLAQGIEHLETPGFNLDLVRSSQTVAALKPKGAGGFDFTPGDLLVQRSQDGYDHLGDLDLRLRVGNSGQWQSYSTAHERHPVTALPTRGDLLASADRAPTLDL